MAKVYLLLGGNIGDRISNLHLTTKLIKERTGKIIQRSSVYESEPWGYQSKNMFLNQVLLVETEAGPEELMEILENIEKKAGREEKGNKYSDRIIDIDILFYNDLIINNDNLIIPHKLLHKRKFALTPLFEISPDFVHPVLKKSIRTLLEECDDPFNVMVFK